MEQHESGTSQTTILPDEDAAAMPHVSKRVPSIAAVILMSMLFGALGGAGSVWYMTQSRSGGSPLVPSTNQKVVLAEESAIVDAVKKASPAVVSIVVSKDLNKIPGLSFDPFAGDPFAQFFGFYRDETPNTPNVQQVGAGSGFFVSKDGLILTNKHVVSDELASYTVVMNDGKTLDAQILARDPVNDLAILKVNIQNSPMLELADTSGLQIGQRVIAIGNSLGQFQNTVTTGVVSGIGRSITAGGNDGAEELEGVIQTDAAINPGNSGGPLLNSIGQVVGINTAVSREGQLVGFAIPANDAKKALDAFQRTGKITRPYLGVRYMLITKSLATNQKLPRDYGALIVRGQTPADLAVIPGSPADKAGLVENDIILELNGKRIDDDHSLSRTLKDLHTGDTVTLKVYHAGAEKTVQVTLGETK